MGASLEQIDAALYGALAPLVAGPPTDAAPFACLARYADEWTADGVAAVGAQYPACLLRFDAEPAARRVDTRGYGDEDRGAPAWTVAVLVEDPRDVDAGIAGATGVPGALACVGKVLAACNSLTIDGLWRGGSVRYVRTERIRALTRPGVVYAFGVTFEAARVVETAAEPADDSADLAAIDADVNLAGEADAAPDPFEQLSADTTDP